MFDWLHIDNPFTDESLALLAQTQQLQYERMMLIVGILIALMVIIWLLKVIFRLHMQNRAKTQMIHAFLSEKGLLVVDHEVSSKALRTAYLEAVQHNAPSIIIRVPIKLKNSEVVEE